MAIVWAEANKHWIAKPWWWDGKYKGQSRVCFIEWSFEQHSEAGRGLLSVWTEQYSRQRIQQERKYILREKGMKSHMSPQDIWYFYSERLWGPMAEVWGTSFIWLFRWRRKPKWTKIKGSQDSEEPSTATQMRSEEWWLIWGGWQHRWLREIISLLHPKIELTGFSWWTRGGVWEEEKSHRCRCEPDRFWDVIVNSKGRGSLQAEKSSREEEQHWVWHVLRLFRWRCLEFESGTALMWSF